jgi:microcystin degradation protein MlrC
MVTDSCEDGEGELLDRIRCIAGADTPVVASLDLHANVTRRMVDCADGLTIFRTYPHVDMADTGARAFLLLRQCLDGARIYSAFRKLPFLIPLTAQCTNFEPCKKIYEELPELEIGGVWSADFATGFPPADIHECGPAVYACGDDSQAVARIVENLYQGIVDAEAEFEFSLMSSDDAVRRAMSTSYEKAVVLADVQDNPGAGGSSDTVGLLHALVRNHARGAVLAILDDGAAARAALDVGEGRHLDFDLGGKSGQDGQFPFKGNFIVERVTRDSFICSGSMYRGMVADIGPLVLLRVNDDACDVRVIVGSERMQCLDLAVFGHMGIDVRRQKVLAIKSTVHFRAEFDRISAETLLVEAPGANPCRLIGLPYKNLRPGIRLEPMGPGFSTIHSRA